MRVTATVEELSEDGWALIQRSTKTSYDFSTDQTRVCVTFLRGDLERHAEMPLGTFVGIMASLGLDRVVREMQTAMAALQPDRLPTLPTAQQVRDLTAADAAALARKMNG